MTAFRPVSLSSRFSAWLSAGCLVQLCSLTAVGSDLFQPDEFTAGRFHHQISQFSHSEQLRLPYEPAAPAPSGGWDRFMPLPDSLKCWKREIYPKNDTPGQDKIRVTLVVQFSKSRKKTLKQLELPADSTVLDLMKLAKRNKKIDFKFRGKGPTAFLSSIDGISNEGARGDNWIFRVNGKLGRKSCGVSKLADGDTVTWSFGKYKP